MSKRERGPWAINSLGRGLKASSKWLDRGLIKGRLWAYTSTQIWPSHYFLVLDLEKD